MKQTDTQWLVLYTKAKHEKKVCELFAKNEITFFKDLISNAKLMVFMFALKQKRTYV
jgi:hypothetical protein